MNRIILAASRSFSIGDTLGKGGTLPIAEMERPMIPEPLSIDGVSVPRMLYGTAWKEDQTARLTERALAEGFRGIDTANQRRHYDEAAVGQGIAAALARGIVKRDQLFLQTKFTFRRSQDHRLPYDPAAPVATQVLQSFASSLEHLGTEWIDSFVLHGPSERTGLTAADCAAWRAMEEIYAGGRARLLGVSNVTLEQLDRLCQEARVPPRFVQNRCYSSQGWDRAVRRYCQSRGMIYQGFSLLTANRQVLAHPEVFRIAKRHGHTVSQIVFRFALDVGMLPLTGTSDPAHMRDDLAVLDFRLQPAEVERIENLGET